MKIEQLIKAVNESVSNEDFAAMSKKADAIKAQQQATTTPANNTIPFPKQPGNAPTTTVAPPAQPSTLKKAWDYANSQQSGADLQKFGKGVADAGGSLSRGAQTVAQGTGNLIKGVGQGINTAGSGVASAIQGVGKVGNATTSALGSIAGGFKQGYQKAVGTSPATSNTSSAAPAGQAANAAGNAELDQLKATIQTMDQRLRRAGI